MKAIVFKRILFNSCEKENEEEKKFMDFMGQRRKTYEIMGK